MKRENIISYLNPREQEIIKLRFGLEGKIEHTLEEIGESLGLSRERVRQIEVKSIKKLKYIVGGVTVKSFLTKVKKLEDLK